MAVSTIVFLAGLALCVVALLIYMRAEDTPFHKTLEKINSVSTDVKELTKGLGDLKSIIEKQNEKIAQAEWELSQMKVVNQNTAKECDAAQDHCAKLREGQIQIQDSISKKRPVTRIQGPIQIEILTPTKRYPGTVKPKQQTKPPTLPKTKGRPKKKTGSNGAPMGRGVAAVMSEQRQ